jgi:hypothetical protein
MQSTPSPEAIIDIQTKLLERAWNALIPACAIGATIIPEVGVRYLHPTKGYRYVGKKRFAVRGVL